MQDPEGTPSPRNRPSSEQQAEAQRGTAVRWTAEVHARAVGRPPQQTWQVAQGKQER